MGCLTQEMLEHSLVDSAELMQARPLLLFFLTHAIPLHANVSHANTECPIYFLNIYCSAFTPPPPPFLLLFYSSPSSSPPRCGHQEVYSMAVFPFPQLAELREKYTYNITPFPTSNGRLVTYMLLLFVC